MLAPGPIPRRASPVKIERLKGIGGVVIRSSLVTVRF